MHKFAHLLITAAGLALVGCGQPKADNNTADAAQKSLSIEAAVRVAEDGVGGYSFSYSAPFFDERGNFDFSREGAAGRSVKVTFKIDDGSVPGLRFNEDGRNAMWIVDKKDVDPETGSPRGPYQGDQFSDFVVSEDRQALTVLDRNDDGVLYRYGLRFDLNGVEVVDDPDGQNGGGNGGD